MRAFVVAKTGPVENLLLTNIESPRITPGTVRIAVDAVGIGFADTLVIAGRYQTKRDTPFVPGSECAGTVLEVGTDVFGVRVGDRVLSTPLQDALADEVVTDAVNVARIPDSMSTLEAAAFPIVYGTAWHALVERANLRSGETVLVHGAGGGVGLACIDVAKSLGATVIASVGSARKGQLARAKGADYVIQHHEDDLVHAVKLLTNGAGVDVVCDPVGGDAFAASLRCIAWGGRVLVLGFASGEIPTLAVNRALLKGCDIVGVYWGGLREKRPDQFHAGLVRVVAEFEAGRIGTLDSTVIGPRQVVESLSALASGDAAGKFVLDFRG
ncbi:NADPH:quinone oxidoreductase family protein [Cryobacterium sp. TMS1-20-1]|uniref:NADPH:quinone oxidoreductase family protein n=1 Tax=Cryobacterium sp. TMS1-20-1 TaxID=1259223 RepID=UPI00106DCE75|nr:NADPH:quinone oxidoreductase family protein [Cryobacterium sp. TMS1-20-1]TFC74888.1 NADPH:quinone oxidoreductase family protein [Cryobacterium sp. TMS1-20-1]